MSVVVVAFAVIGSSASAAPSGSGLAVLGHGTVGSGVGAQEVGIHAISPPGGEPHGRYVVAGEFTHVVQVECIRTVADFVQLGGHISWSSNPVVIGRTGMIAIRDDAAGDSVGIAFSISGLDTCPTWSPTWIPVTEGDFRAQPLGPAS